MILSLLYTDVGNKNKQYGVERVLNGKPLHFLYASYSNIHNLTLHLQPTTHDDKAKNVALYYKIEIKDYDLSFDLSLY